MSASQVLNIPTRPLWFQMTLYKTLTFAMGVHKERKSTFLTAFEHREKRPAACLLHNIFIAVVPEYVCHLRAQYPEQLPDLQWLTYFRFLPPMCH